MRLKEKEEEFEQSRKITARALELMQATLEAETRAKCEGQISRLKRISNHFYSIESKEAFRGRNRQIRMRTRRGDPGELRRAENHSQVSGADEVHSGKKILVAKNNKKTSFKNALDEEQCKAGELFALKEALEQRIHDLLGELDTKNMNCMEVADEYLCKNKHFL